MLDFTSALYLGFTHPNVSLARWSSLTLGRPAALEEPPGAAAVAETLARLSGAAAGLLFSSTLHLFRDLFGIVGAKDATLLVDAQAYPIARWGTEHVRLEGTVCETYPHHDAAGLVRKARRAFRAGLRPIVVTDGLCPSCGRLAPLPELARAAADYGGQLVVDDTQALGVIGKQAGSVLPLGLGGGGTLAWYGLGGPHISVGMSLAKGFGAPLAVLVGGKNTIERVAREGDSRIHASPPSTAAIAAAQAALASNTTGGDLLRARLVRLIGRLRQGLVRIGARILSTSQLPVQSGSRSPRRSPPAGVVTALELRGIRAPVTKTCRGGLGLSMLLTARHTAGEVDRLIDALALVLKQGERNGNN